MIIKNKYLLILYKNFNYKINDYFNNLENKNGRRKEWPLWNAK